MSLKMSLKMQLAILFLSALTICSESAALAQGQSTVAPSPMKGVEWTKIQDLKPEARALNRPIKQKWAVVVGAAKFKEKRLNGDEVAMDQSARQFYDYLLDPHGGRFAKDHVKLLLNSDATRQNIISTLGDSFLGSLAGPDDLVVVFIATNSFPTTDGSTYLCAYDVAIDNIYSTCLSMQTLMDTLKHSVKTDRIVLVLQACYSGAAQLNSGAKALYSGYNIDLDKVVLGKGYIIVSSSQPNEMTWGDVFSRNLTQALRKDDGLVSLEEAFAEARQKTINETSVLGDRIKKQTPVLKSDWSGNDLVIGTPPVEQVKELPDKVLNFLSAEAYYLQATKLVAKGDLDEAISQYKKALSVSPGYADALADYGAVLAVRGDWEGAAKLYERAIGAEPEDGLYHINYARVLDRLGRQKEAQEELELSYRYSPKDKVVLTALSSKELSSGSPQRAVRLLKEATALYPASSSLRERLSYALIKTGDVNEAVIQAQQAVELEPKSASAQLNLGSSLLLQGDREKARQAYQQALALAPNNADAHFLMSKLCEAEGDKSAAQLELDKFISLSPAADTRTQSARKHLAELKGEEPASR